MLEEKDLPPHTVANGPDGLKQVLTDFQAQSQASAAFAEADHYILYQFNQQKALIKVGMNQQPYHFWYYDLLGRPATKMVKEVIGQFLWDHCGEKERYLTEVSGK